MSLAAADGFAPSDERGKDNLEPEDVFAFEARVYFASLVEGSRRGEYLSMVAGA